MMEVVTMIRSYKASRAEVLLSYIRYTVRVLLPDIAAGIALVALLVLLPVVAALVL